MTKQEVSNTCNKTTMLSIGVDLGSKSTVLAMVSSDDDERNAQLLRNNDMLVSTPTSLSFDKVDGSRSFGSAAISQRSSNTNNTFDFLNLLAGMKLSEFQELRESVFGDVFFEALESETELGEIQLKLDCSDVNAPKSICATALVSSYLAKLVSFANNVSSKENIEKQFYFAIPKSFSEHQRAALMDAAKIAGMGDVSLVSNADALAAAYAKKHWNDNISTPEEKDERVLLIDLGYSQATACVISRADEVLGYKIHHADSSADFGAKSIDNILFAHFQSESKAKHNVSIIRRSRVGQRLMRHCVKAKTVLSAIESTSFLVDQLRVGLDAKFSIKREDLIDMCSSLQENFKLFLESILNCSNVLPSDITSVELTGGGSRVPFIQENVQNLVGDCPDGTSKLSFTLDIGNALSCGAALLGAKISSASTVQINDENDSTTAADTDDKKDDTMDTDDKKDDTMDTDEVVPETQTKDNSSLSLKLGLTWEKPESLMNMTEEQINILKLAENEMVQCDIESAKQASLKNAFEAYMYTARGYVDTEHGNLIDSEELNKLVDAAEEWFWETGCSGTGDNCSARHEQLEHEIREKFPAYFEAVAAAKKKVESELLASQTLAAAEEEARIAAGGEENDYDRRKLKHSKRMELALKQKLEGNELFKDKNFEHAARRYVKALNQCDKVFDQSQEQKEETKTMQLSCYLNLAQCWLKMEKPRKVIDNCFRALEIDPKSVKALHRRGTAYLNTKEIDLSMKDCKAALKIASEKETKALLKLQKKVQRLINIQKAKAKKMAKKMFA